MRRILVAAAAVAVFACLAPLSTAAAQSANNGREYYLALGDSLSQGAQPNAQGTTVPTDQGYANDLYAQERSRYKHLSLVDLGCLGETTTTMINGGICSYHLGSQLNQAVAFLHAHKSHVAFVTLDVGANDVDGCATGNPPTGVNIVCLGKGVQSIETNLPKIAAALRKAAAPNVPIIGMTYYDPFLAAWLEPNGEGVPLAAASQGLDRSLINKAISGIYQAEGLEVADVADAFQTYVPLSKTVLFDGQQVPVAVVQICELTWMCAPAPQGPNIHANAAGYSVIADAFAKLL